MDNTKFVRARSVRIIFGGHHIAGDGNNSMKSYPREVRHRPLTNVNHLTLRPPILVKEEAINITFTDDDARGVHHPHNDALVINVLI